MPHLPWSCTSKPIKSRKPSGKNRSRRAHLRGFRFRPPDQRPHSYQGGGIAAVDEPLSYPKMVRVATKVFPLNRIVESLQQPRSVEYGQSHS